MKWFKRVLLGVLALVIVAVAGAVAFIATIDKGFVEDIARDNTGRAVTIDSLDLNLLSTTPSVSLRGFTLPNAEWGTAPHAAKIGTLEAELKLMPLLSGVVDVTKIVLTDADIHYETDAGGKNNLTFEPAGGAGGGQPSHDDRDAGSSGGEGGFSLPIIRLIDIDNVAVTMLDGQTGKENRVTIETLSLQGSGPGEPLDLAVVGQAFVDGQPDALPINLTGLLGSPRSMLDASERWDVQISGDAAGLDVLVDGSIQDPTTGRGVDVAVAIAGTELADAAKIAGIDVPTIGAFDIKASALGDADGDLSISDISVNIGKPDFVRVELKGNIASATALEGVDLSLKVDSVDTAKLSPVVRKFTGHKVPSLGPYKLTAKVLGGQSGGLAVRDIDFALGRSDLLVVNAKGAVGDILNAGGISIGFRVVSPEVGALSPIAEPYIGQPIPNLGQMNIGGVVTGGLKTGVSFSDLELTLGKESLALVTATGGVGNLELSGYGPIIGNVNLALNVTGTDTANLSSLAETYAGQSVPSIGPFSVAAKVIGDGRKVIRVDGIDVSVGALPELLLTATGSVENAMSITGVDIAFKVNSAEVGDLEPLVQNFAGPDVKVPALGALSVGGSVISDAETALALSNLDLQLGESKLVQISASGGIANLLSQTGIGIGFKVKSDQVGNLQPIAQQFAGPDVKVPALGALDANGTIAGDAGGVLALQGLGVELGTNKIVAVSVKGSVGNLINRSGVDISFSVAGDETGNLSPIVREMTGENVPKLGAFSATAGVKGDMHKGFSVNGLDVSVGDTQTALLTAKGSVADAIAVKGIDLAIAFESPDMAVFSGMAGGSIPAVGPVTVTGNFKGGTEKILTFSNFLAKFGHSDLTGSASVDFQGDVPFLKAAFTSESLNIKDFYKEEQTDPADGGTGNAGAASGSAQPDDGRVIPKDPLPLDALKSINADVSVKVAQLGLTRTTMSNMEVGLTLQDGDLKLTPLKADAAGGGIDGSLRLNASKEIPELGVKFKGNELDLGVALHMFEIAPMITGPLTIDISLAGLGDNPRAIASTLGGYAKVAVVDGRAYSEAIRDELGSGADVLISLLFGGKNSVIVECLVADYEVKGGVANTKIGVIETGVATVTVEGSANLGNETLDLTIDPKARVAGVVGVSVPVIVGGTFADPSFTPNPGKAILGAGLGVLTGGATLGLAALLDQALPEDHPCAVLGDKQGATGVTQGSSSTGIQPAQPAQPAQQQPTEPKNIEDAAKDAAKSLFNNLLGN